MFSAVRRFGVSQVLRASATRSVAIQWTPQLLKGQTQSIRSPALHRSFQTFPALKSAAAEAISQAGESFEEEPELITQFIDLKNKGLIDPRIVRNITSEDRMGLKTMTPVQSQTIHQMLRGDDVYVNLRLHFDTPADIFPVSPRQRPAPEKHSPFLFLPCKTF